MPPAMANDSVPTMPMRVRASVMSMARVGARVRVRARVGARVSARVRGPYLLQILHGIPIIPQPNAQTLPSGIL